MAKRSIAVLGTGGWGTAIALLLDGKGFDVRLWGRRPEFVETLLSSRVNERYLPGIKIPDSVRLLADISEATRDTELLVCGVPTQHIRPALAGLASRVTSPAPVVSLSKGIENDTLLLPTQVLAQLFGAGRSYAVLSGPSHAEEVARGQPTTVVVASRDSSLALAIQETFSTKRFRVYTNTDVLGVELAGALKNVIALAAGASDGLGYGDNAKSALLTRGLAEIARLGVAMGARRETFAGLAGMGDLITTCVSPFGRNRAVGLQIAKGKKLSQILAETSMVAEGVKTTLSTRALARRSGIEMPITEQAYEVLFNDKDPRQAVLDLMMRPLQTEAEVVPSGG
ncbi:MAG: NAD(P)-dependent glycerol-3-phosphate dehydrogenase [Planctomycetes bacterium]|nr:NAD(P)-dependent glycerol-3-phosphate dehydrogenase [Planctomycetota bacterium]